MSVKIKLQAEDSSEPIEIRYPLPESILNELFYSVLTNDVDFKEEGHNTKSMNEYLTQRHPNVIFGEDFIKERMKKYEAMGLVLNEPEEGEPDYYINEEDFNKKLLSPKEDLML